MDRNYIKLNLVISHNKCLRGVCTISHDIDIIIPVYNALYDVQHCVQSILDNSNSLSIRLIVVNDASGEETTQLLRYFDKAESCILLVENENNQGYAQTVNVGMSLSTARYVVLLNSDTVVSENWLEKLICCAESDPAIGIVSPVTNSAIWQSVPYIPDPTVSTRYIPDAEEINDFAKLVFKCSYSIYPQLPYIHGFCQFIKKEVVDTIGFVDEKNFPNGLGSEQDYCYRAADAGFLSVIADDTFIYHSKAKSLNKAARKLDWVFNLNAKYGEQRHKVSRYEVLGCSEMNSLRMATSFEVYRKTLDPSASSFNYNICMVINSVDDIEAISIFSPLLLANKIGRSRTTLLIREESLVLSLKQHNHISKLKEQLIVFHTDKELLDYFLFYDVVIYLDVQLLKNLCVTQNRYPDLLVTCYIDNRAGVHKNISLHAKEVDPLTVNPILFLTNSDTIAKAVIHLLGAHVINLVTLYKENDEVSIFNKFRRFFDPINYSILKTQQKALLRLLKDAILYYRKDQCTVVFSKNVPPKDCILNK